MGQLHCDGVTKPYGKIRICIDPSYINCAILREHFLLKNVEEVAATMPEARIFSILDATSGFWQTKLDYESHTKLYTFNSPFRRYVNDSLECPLESSPRLKCFNVPPPKWFRISIEQRQLLMISLYGKPQKLNVIYGWTLYWIGQDNITWSSAWTGAQSSLTWDTDLLTRVWNPTLLSPSSTGNGLSRKCEGLAYIYGLRSILRKVYAHIIRSWQSGRKCMTTSAPIL